MSDTCTECNRRLATDEDEGIHNTGECGCSEARSLCWKKWNGGFCLTYSIYDPDHGQEAIKNR
jgi:hypothetical protein